MRVRQVQLRRIPAGRPTADDFEVVDAQVPDATPGQVTVRVRRLGLNAGLASRIGGSGSSYGPGIDVGDVPASDAIVEVMASDADGFAPGDLAVRISPWRSQDACDPGELRRIDPPDDVGLIPYLTVLGHVGLTAYTGMIHVGAVRATDIVCVSAAAGGVGSCAVQFAKAHGATVIGVAGSDEKVALLTEVLGADTAIDRHDGDAVDLLRAAAPDGIDLYFDNVGGEQLEAALEVLNHGGRAIICGRASGASGGPANYANLIGQELTMRGFTVTEHEDLRERFERDVSTWIRQGRVHSIHTVFEGVHRVPEAFASLLAGTSTGRVIVDFDDE